jgi:putative drug exporter of the RND superfamily
MMSNSLYRLGRFAARRPWAVIGAWLVLSALVVAASSTFGQKLEDSFGAPGVDSQHATDLLSAAGSDQAGLTAQVVVTPRDDQVTFFSSPDARAALSRVQSAAAELPHVLATSDPAGTATATPGRRTTSLD